VRLIDSLDAGDVLLADCAHDSGAWRKAKSEPRTKANLQIGSRAEASQAAGTVQLISAPQSSSEPTGIPRGSEHYSGVTPAADVARDHPIPSAST
jgi:hypothetical protein